MIEINELLALATKLKTKTDYKSADEVDRDLDNVLSRVKAIQKKVKLLRDMCSEPMIGSDICDRITEVLK